MRGGICALAIASAGGLGVSLRTLGNDNISIAEGKGRCAFADERVVVSPILFRFQGGVPITGSVLV